VNRANHRLFWIAVTLITTTLPWAALALLSRDVPPSARTWIDPLLAAALIVTYAGICSASIVLSANRRHALFRAVATTLGIAVTLVMLELPAMLRWVHWTIVFRQVLGEGFDYQSAFVRDRDLAYRRIPGLQWSGRPLSDVEEAYGLPRSLSRPITFTDDRWGYRNASDMEHADVVLLGDSYVEGWYVSDEQTAAAQLTARLHRPVANLGVAGYGTLQELRGLKDDALRRQPAVVAWVFFEGNDLYDDHGFEATLMEPPPGADDVRPHSEGLTRSHGWAKRSFVSNALKQARRWSYPLVLSRAPFEALLLGPSEGAQPVYFFKYGGVPWTDYEEERWRVARAAFEEGAAFARERGIHLVFLYAPIKFRVFRDFIKIPEDSPMKGWNAWDKLPLYFQDFCASSTVPCVNLTEVFKQATRDGRLPYPLNDTHWSAEGHAIVAGILESVIREHGW
jgi:lysophospholipase L1-like esterase